MKMKHGVVLLRNGPSVRIAWNDAKKLLEDLGGKRRVLRPAQSNYFVAKDPFDGSPVLLDKNLICMIHMWTEEGLERSLEFYQYIRDRQEDFFDDSDGSIPDDWGPGAY